MAVTVKKATLWRREVENKTGVLAPILEPLAAAGTDLQVVMGYRYPGNESKAAIELYPVSNKKAMAAAQAAGLNASSIPTLLNQTTKDWHTRSVTLSETKGLSERFFAPLRMTRVSGRVTRCTNVVWFDLVQGDNKPGLGYATAKAIADAGINLSFLVAQVIGSKYSAVFGFETPAGADKAATLIKKATAAKRK